MDVCVHALVGSLVPMVNGLVWDEGTMTSMAEPLCSSRVGAGHPIRGANGHPIRGGTAPFGLLGEHVESAHPPSQFILLSVKIVF